MHLLSKSAKILTVHAGTTAAATTTLDSAFIDRSGYESALFFGSVGATSTDNGIDVLVSTSSSTANAEDVLNSRVQATSTAVMVDIQRLPVGKRYLFGRYIRTTSATAGKMVCILYNARSLPVDNATSTQAVQTLGNASTGQSTSTSST